MIKISAIRVSIYGLLVLVASPAAALGGCTGSNCIENPNNINIPMVSLGDGTTFIVNTLILIAGFLSVFFLVVGGVRYITSDGDPGRASTARQTITYAIIGLILAILARVIIGFVLDFSPQ